VIKHFGLIKIKRELTEIILGAVSIEAEFFYTSIFELVDELDKCFLLCSGETII